MPGLHREKTHGALVEGEDSGHDRGDRGRGREHGPRRPAVGFEVVPAVIQEIRDPGRVGHRGSIRSAFGRQIASSGLSSIMSFPPPSVSLRRCGNVNGGSGCHPPPRSTLRCKVR